MSSSIRWEKKERKTQLSQHHQKFHHRRISESDLTTIWFEGVSKPPLSLSLLLPLASVSANYARSNLRTVYVYMCVCVDALSGIYWSVSNVKIRFTLGNNERKLAEE